MTPHLANQNVDVPTKQAYLNLELTLFSLCGNGMGLPLSLSSIYPSLVAQSPSRSLTQAYRVFTCNLKWAFEAQQVCVMPPSTLPPLIGQSSMTSSAEDCRNQVK